MLKKRLAITITTLFIIAPSLYLIYNKMLKTDTTHNEQTTDITQPTQKETEKINAYDADKKKDSLEQKNTEKQNDTKISKVEITAKQEENNTITIFTKLQGFSDGTCTATLRNGSKVIKLTANIIYQSEFSTCAGFSVPVNNLGNGIWQINITASSTNNNASSDINFEVK